MDPNERGRRLARFRDFVERGGPAAVEAVTRIDNLPDVAAFLSGFAEGGSSKCGFAVPKGLFTAAPRTLSESIRAYPDLPDPELFSAKERQTLVV
jgi:hypothetical protein